MTNVTEILKKVVNDDIFSLLLSSVKQAHCYLSVIPIHETPQLDINGLKLEDTGTIIIDH